MDALCGVPHAGRAVYGGGQLLKPSTHLLLHAPNPSSFPARPARTLSSLPLGGAPQLDGEGEGVVLLLSLKLGQALWVPATDLGAWDPLGLGVEVFGQEEQACSVPTLSLAAPHVPPQISKSLLGCRE